MAKLRYLVSILAMTWTTGVWADSAVMRDVPQCAQGMQPTGCFAPYDSCMPGNPNANPISSCLTAARSQHCPDFSWEKCCFITCTPQLAGNGQQAYTQCMNFCGQAVEAHIYWPHAPQDLTTAGSSQTNGSSQPSNTDSQPSDPNGQQNGN